MKKVPRPAIILVTLLGIWVLLLPWFYRDLFDHYFYMPFLGIIGATVANTTPAAAGIVYFPSLTQLQISPATAVQFSLIIQAYGMGLGTYKWYWVNKKLFLWNLMPICLSAGLLGIFTSMLIIPIQNPQLLSLTFNTVAFLFTQVILFSILFEHQYPNLVLQLTGKRLVLLALFSFTGGLISGWIGFGIDTLFYFLLTLRFRIHPAVAIVTSISLMAAMSLAGTLINCVYYEVPLSLWYSAIPGVTVAGLFLATYLAVKLGAKNILLLFTALLSLNFLLSFWNQTFIPLDPRVKTIMLWSISGYLLFIHLKILHNNPRNLAAATERFDLKP
ncbi:MAG: sulfite exporter TauE/SafE family protein [Desulfuromonadaceae bacterium]